jgi:hypothetical protein
MAIEYQKNLNGHNPFAQGISNLINSKDHMVHIQPDTVQAYAKSGLAVWASHANEFAGFIKAVPWNPKLMEVQGEMETIEAEAIKLFQAGLPPTGFESGSLIVPDSMTKNGIGGDLKETLAQQILAAYPGIPLFSVVDETNEKSVKLNLEHGWKKISQKTDFDMIQQLCKKVGMDIIQGWDKACVFMHPQSYVQLFQ